MSSPVQLFKGALSNAFKASSWLLIQGHQLTFTWQLTVATGGAQVQFYLEFSDDPTLTAPTVSREVDEQDTGNGSITMSKVIRTFQESGGGSLAAGTQTLSTQFVRQAPYARVQVQVASGAATLILTSSSGSLLIVPS